MDNTTNTNLEDAIKELGVPPVPPMPPVGSVPEGEAGAETSPADAIAAELTNDIPAMIPPAPAGDDAAATLDALVADAPATPAADVAQPADTPAAPVAATTEVAGDLDAVKKSMLKDLFPIMDKVSITPEQRFRVYHEMIEDTGDKTLITPAYEAAKAMTDDVAKAEALLFLVESADK